MKNLIIFSIFFIQFLLSAQEIPELKVPYIEGNVKIDGILDENCWKNSTKITDFIITYGSNKEILGKKPKNKTIGYIFYDKDYLYVGVECYDENTGNLKTERMIERDKGWGDDCVEIFVDPGLSRKRCFQWIINSRNIVYDQKHDSGKGIEEGGWDSGFESGVKIYKDRWVVETKIPLAELELTKDIGDNWGFNITRFEPREWIVQSWAPVYGGNLQPEKFGIIKGIKIDYSKYNFRVDLIRWGSLFWDDFVEISIENLEKNKKQINCELFVDEKLMSMKNLILKPEEKERISLNYKIEKKDKKLSILIKDKDENLCYLRTKYFKTPDTCFNVKPEVPIYYLSEPNLISELEIFLGMDTISKSEIMFEIYDEKGNLKINKKIKGLKQNRMKIPIGIKNLPEGRYILKVALKLKGEILEEKEVSFEKIKGPFD